MDSDGGKRKKKKKKGRAKKGGGFGTKAWSLPPKKEERGETLL